MKKTLFVLFLALLLVGCGDPQDEYNAAIASIATFSYTMAIGAMQWLSEKGYNIPPLIECGSIG